MEADKCQDVQAKSAKQAAQGAGGAASVWVWATESGDSVFLFNSEDQQAADQKELVFHIESAGLMLTWRKVSLSSSYQAFDWCNEVCSH